MHAAYEGLARIEGRGVDHAFWAIMLRCLELLGERSPILTDLAMLADPARNPEPHEQAYWATILQYYTNVRPLPLLLLLHCNILTQFFSAHIGSVLWYPFHILTHLAVLVEPARNPELHCQACWACILQYYDVTSILPGMASACHILRNRAQQCTSEHLGAGSLALLTMLPAATRLWTSNAV